MKNILNNAVLNLIIRIVVGGLFLFSGIAKISNPGQFAEQIANYNILPEIGIFFSAMTLPWIELFSGLLLIIGMKQKANAFLISLLLIVFIFAIGIAMLQGLSIDCGCQTGIAAQKVGFPKIFENIGFLIGSIYIFLFPNAKLTLTSFAQGD